MPAASLRRSGLSVCVWVCCSHGNQVVTGTAEEAFDFSDSDKNGALNKKCEPPATQPCGLRATRVFLLLDPSLTRVFLG